MLVKFETFGLFLKTSLPESTRGVKAGMLGLVLAGNVACTQELQTVVPENTLGTPVERPSEYGTPYTKTLGNGHYSIRNFIGEAEIGAGRTMLEDVNYYLRKAEIHTQGELNDFEKTLKGRPAAQIFFKNYISEQRNNNYTIGADTAGQDLDRLINNMSNANKKIDDKIKANLTEQECNNYDACCLALEAESYYLGLGKKRNEPQFLTKYHEMHGKARVLWIKNNEVIPFNLDKDIEERNCTQITQMMDRILGTAVENMDGVTLADLQNYKKINFFEKSTEAFHDVATEKLLHLNQCNVNSK